MSTATLPAPTNGAVIDDDWTMSVPEPGGNYVPCPAGNHLAICIGLVALGTHDDTYQGETKSAEKLALLFETPGEIDPDGNPFTFALEFTKSLHEKAKLRTFLEGWRGQKYGEEPKVSLAVVVGKACLLNVTHGKGGKKGDRVYANAGAATPLPKGMQAPKAFHDAVIYPGRELAAGVEPPSEEWLPRIYGRTLAEVVKGSEEWKARNGTPASSSPAASDTDDIPF